MTDSHKNRSNQASVPATAPQEHLSEEMKTFWRAAIERKSLQPHELLILEKACETFDRARQAQQILERDGLTFTDRFGQPRSRPEIAIERDSKAAFAKLIGKINLHVMEEW